MRKILILIVALFMLTGCGGNKTYDEISYDELNKMLEDKQDFILFIGSDTCSACNTYKGTLNDVIEEYGTDVKYIDLASLSEAQESSLISKFPITGTPTTVFITNGEEEDTHNRIVGSAKKSEIIEEFKDNGYIKGW